MLASFKSLFGILSPSSKPNLKMFNPGAIRKVTLTNFITHGYLEVYPGPQLNLILGSNGSGKSSIVAGIILGLGGTPKVIGRGNKVSEYIKHGHNSAKIVLQLQGMTPTRTISITRKIDITDTSTWSVDGQKVTWAQVKEAIAEYNMQVDNLCQFLPQDRVAEFARMNKQKLLEETLKALCRTDLVDKLKELIDDREQQISLLEKVQQSAKKLEDYNERFARLAGRVKNVKKRRTILTDLENIDRKKAWTKYLLKNDERLSAKRDRDSAQQVCAQKQEVLKPIRKAVSHEQRILEEKHLSYLSTTSQQEKLRSNIDEKQRGIDGFLEQFQQIQDQHRNALASLEDSRLELESTENRLRQCQNDKKVIEVVAQNDKLQLENLQKEVFAHESKIQEICAQASSNSDLISAKNHEIAALNNQKQSIDRLVASRLAFLQKVAPDAHAGTLWLRQNKQLFHSEVYEPIMLQINVVKQQYAKYIENSIPFRDKVAFLCTNKEDVALLHEHLCKRQGLRLNVLYQDPEASAAQPTYKIEQLQHFGFVTYVNCLFHAPGPIMAYLCRSYNLHNIPIDFKGSDINAADVPVNVFYHGNYRMRISSSKYTGKKTFQQSEIASDQSLSYCIDSSKCEKIDSQIEELTREVVKLQQVSFTINEQLKDQRLTKAGIESKMQQLRVSSQNMVNVNNKIKSLERKLSEMKLQNIANSAEKINEETKAKSNCVGLEIRASLEEINAQIKKYVELDIKAKLVHRVESYCRNRITSLEEESETMRSELREAEITVQTIRSKLADITQEAKACLQHAKSLSNGFTPDEAGFDAFRAKYDNLPQDLDELDTLGERLEQRLSALSNLADENELAEYEECSREIERLDAAIKRMQSDLDEMTSKIANNRIEWMRPLEEFLAHINDIFSQSFTSMGCVGEVKLWVGEDEDDYTKYGICIRVTYRNDSPLQELNSITQSGGERAVATAVYMISLQELTPVPFRCVDEINQGMDANNERRIFDLLMHVTSKSNSSQFFMVSPKMVPEMKFTDNVTVIIIHNSDSVQVKQSEWHGKWNSSLMP